MTDEKIGFLRRAFEREAVSDQKVLVSDASVERNGDAYDGGFTVSVRGTTALAEVHVGRYMAHLMYTEYSGGQSLHPVPELASDLEVDQPAANRMVAEVLQRVRTHVNQSG